MDYVVPFFPIFNLPNNALMNVLQQMETVPKIGLSILSEKAKNLVKSLNLKANDFYISIDNEISVNIIVSNTQAIQWQFIMEEYDVPIPYCVQVLSFSKGEREICKFINGRISINEWIDHLMFEFNQSKIN